MATINHKKYDEATETFKDFYVYDGKETLIFKVDGENHKVEITGTLDADNITGSGIIKTSDNGPLSATAKYLSDGLGNNSVLALSTSRIGVGKIPDTFRLDLNAADGNIARFSYTDADATFEIAGPAVNIVQIGAASGDSLAIAAGGTEAMRITSAGNVGIGTASPQGELDVKGSTNVAVYLRNSSNGDTATDGLLLGNVGGIPASYQIWNYENGYLRFGTNGSERLRITDTGNLYANATGGARGGVTTQNLFKNSSGTLYTELQAYDTSSSVGLLFSDGSGGNYGLLDYTPTDEMLFYTAASEKMRITSAGNVGIGTSSPTQKLDVVGYARISYGVVGSSGLLLYGDVTSANSLFVSTAGDVGIGTTSPSALLHLGNNGNTSAASLLIDSSTIADATAKFAHNANVEWTIGSDETSGTTNTRSFVFSKGSALGTNDRLVITHGGNVGIGTNSPATALHVNGNITVGTSHFIGDNAFSSLLIQSSATENILLDAQDDLILQTVGATKMIIKNAGNVGIGTSSPSGAGWDESATILHIYKNTTSGGLLRLESSNTSAILNAGNNQLAIFTTTDDPIRFGTNGSERVRVTNDGLTFNGDTAAANALDDYEEGTFTPSITFGGGSTGITYFDRAGVYTKIGQQVTCSIYMAITNVGSSTGSVNLTGLPFTNGNVSRGNQSAASIRFDNITYTGSLCVTIPNSTTYLVFQQVTEAGVDSVLTNSNFSGSSEMSITITYFV